MAEPSLYKSISKKAKDENRAALVRDIQEENRNKPYVLFEDDEYKIKTLGYLQKLFDNADAARPDTNWDINYLQWVSETLYSDDGKANINLAIEKAVVRNKLADMNSMRTVLQFIPTEEDDINKVDVAKVLWNFTAAESDLEYQLAKHKRQALIFGSSPWLETVTKDISTRYEPTIDQEGKINGSIRTVVESYIDGYPLDIRKVWFDPVPDWKRAQYCFYLEEGLLYEDIEALKEDPNFDAEAIDQMLASMQTRNRAETIKGHQVFSTREEIQDNTKLKYNLMHFWHKKKGIYIVCDDTFSHIIREGVSPYPHRELPITMLVDHRDMYSMYGYGECDLLRSTKYERNEIRNQLLDGVRIGNTMNLLVGETVSFEGNETIGGIMNVWNVKGNSNDARFLQSPQMNSGLWQMDSMLMNDATWLTSIDINSLVGQPTQTAFQAGLQEQTKLKGIAECVREFDFWYRDMARQRMKNIQFFMPTTTGKNILGEDKKDKYRTIALKGKSMELINGINLKNGEVVQKGVKFKDEEGATAFFELTPDAIASNLDVSIETPTTTPILRDIRSHEASELVNVLLQVAQTPQGADILQKFDLEKLIKKQFVDKGYDPDDFMADNQDEANLKEIRSKVLGDIPAPPHAMAQPTKSRLLPDTPQIPQNIPPQTTPPQTVAPKTAMPIAPTNQ